MRLEIAREYKIYFFSFLKPFFIFIKITVGKVHITNKVVIPKIKELVKLGEEYQTFAGNSDNQDSETKFVLVMDGQKLEKEVKVNDSSKTETTFIQRIKNLFK